MGNTCYGHNIINQANTKQSCDSNNQNKQNNLKEKVTNPQVLYSQFKTFNNFCINQCQRQKILSSKKQLSIYINQLFLKCKGQYNQHYIDNAYIHGNQIFSLLQQSKKRNIQFSLNNQQIQLLDRIKMQYNDVIHYEEQIDKGGWEEKDNQNRIKISCRRQPDGKTVGCRIETVTDVPFQVLISVMTQIQYYKDYTPFLQISRAERQVARNCRLGYTLNSMPFFTKRQAYFQGIGYSRLQSPKQQLFLFTRSLHDKQHLQTLLQFPIQVNKNYIQMDYKYFVVRYKPLKKNLGIIDIGMNVDVKMDFIPTWLIQKVSKDFGENFFTNIVKISKNFKGSKWQKNVQKNPGLFLYFQKQVENYLAGKQQK